MLVRSASAPGLWPPLTDCSSARRKTGTAEGAIPAGSRSPAAGLFSIPGSTIKRTTAGVTVAAGRPLAAGRAGTLLEGAAVAVVPIHSGAAREKVEALARFAKEPR